MPGLKDILLFFASAAALFCAGCSPMRAFYHPNNRLYLDPEKQGIPFEVVWFESLNGKKLSGLWFPFSGEPAGTVVHFHGNFGNVSNHYPQSVFLAKRGFDVLIFDYQGFGGSEGKPTPEGTVEDGIAAIRFAAGRQRAGSQGVVVLGQSLGAAVASVAAAKEPLVKAVVLEAGFSSYPRIAATALRRGILTWPFSFGLPSLLIRRTPEPIDHVDDLAPRPLLIIHGKADRVVPFWMSEKLYEAAREPKTLWLIDGAGHLECQSAAGEEYRGRIETFFKDALSGRAPEASPIAEDGE